MPERRLDRNASRLGDCRKISRGLATCDVAAGAGRDSVTQRRVYATAEVFSVCVLSRLATGGNSGRETRYDCEERAALNHHQGHPDRYTTHHFFGVCIHRFSLD